jgi:hypothetical protein
MCRRRIGYPVMIEHHNVHAELSRAFDGRMVFAATVDGHE